MRRARARPARSLAMMVFGMPVLMIALGGAGPDVRGGGDCPSADEVAAHLRPLLPRGGELPPDSWLELAATSPAATPSGGARARQIEVRLLTRGGTTAVASRRLAVAGSCAEAAEAVAVVAASWMADYLTPPAPAPWLPEHVIASPPSNVSAQVALSPGDGPESARIAFDVGIGAGLTIAASGSGAPFLTAEVDV